MTVAAAGPAAADAGRAPGSWAVILAGRRGRLLVGLALTELVVAMQILVVITVLPEVVRQLGGVRLYGLALSAAAVAGIGAAPAAAALLGRAGARAVVPAGALVFGCGAPAITMAVFCCSFAFFAVDGFVPLLLTTVGGRSVSTAGIVVTLAVLSWTIGGMLQARLAGRGWTPPRLIAAGAALIAVGIGGTALGLVPGAWLAPYLAWAVGGFGMGLAYTGVWLAAMAAGPDTAASLIGPLVADRTGTALGAGAGGVCIAFATRSGLGVGTGIGVGMAVAAAAVCALAAASRRTA